MKLIQNNPYRIVGLLSNTSERDLQRQKSKLTRYASIGRKIETDLDFSFLGAIDRNEEQIIRSFSSIEKNNDKVNNAIFWFSVSNSFDGAAINYLSKGDKAKAIEIWEKITWDKDVTNKNFSCFNNFGTLMLLGLSLNEIKIGVAAKLKLIQSPIFVDFIGTVADETFVVDREKQMQKFIDAICHEFSGKFTNNEIISLFSSCNATAQKYITKQFTEEPIHKIEAQIEITKEKRKNSSIVSADLGIKLYTICKDDLYRLKSLLGQNDLIYKMISSSLAKEILQCGIDYFVDNGQEEEDIDHTIKILETANGICLDQTTKDRIEGHLNDLKEMKYAEMQGMISVLKNIQRAINELEIQNKGKTYLEKQIINKEKVDEILRKEISSIRIQKLIDSNNKFYLDEFITLATFLNEKLFSTGTKKIINLLITNLPSTHKFVISEEEKRKKLAEEARMRKRKAEGDEIIKRINEEARRKREAEKEVERKRKESEEDQRFWIIFLGVIGLILLIAGAIWGWDGVIGVIVVGVLIMIGGSSR